MKVLLCGATGSIGTTFLKLDLGFELVGISYHSNIKKAKQIIDKYHVKYYYSDLDDNANCNNIDELIKKANPDIVINAVVGISGLKYSILCLKNKKNLYLANKESLVIAGKFLKELAKKNKVTIIPIDSEHTSLCELILSHKENIKKLYITCSGGSFYHFSNEQLKKVKYDDATKHPNWSMGPKITIDSNTLMNKCFEIIEAYHLFETKNIEALYHKQSIIHSLLQFEDNSLFANMSYPDMGLSIELAINNFKKSAQNKIKELDFTNLDLNLSKIDINKWKPIKWAYDAINDDNNCLGLILNFANEYAIDLFKQNKISFDEIYQIIEKFILKYKNNKINSFEDIYKVIEKMRIEKI